jgi:molybdopterin adenylyltransferase
MKFKIISVQVSERKGTRKNPVEVIELVKNHGIPGDAHAGAWHRQISLLASEAVEWLASKKPGIHINPGDFGENILTRGIDWSRVQMGGTIRINQTLLEVTQIGKVCHNRCAIYEQVGDCIMPTRGIFARVLKGGPVRANDRGDYYFR